MVLFKRTKSEAKQGKVKNYLNTLKVFKDVRDLKGIKY